MNTSTINCCFAMQFILWLSIFLSVSLAATKTIIPGPSATVATVSKAAAFTPTAAPAAAATQTVGGSCNTATTCATESKEICAPRDYFTATSACRTVSPCSTSCGFYARKTSTKLPGANPSDCDMYYCILCPTYSCLSCPDGNATLTSFSGKCPSCYCAPTATVSAGVHTLEAGSTVDTAVVSLLTAPPIAT